MIGRKLISLMQRSATPPGSASIADRVSGGVASLNPRLMASTPTGVPGFLLIVVMLLAVFCAGSARVDEPIEFVSGSAFRRALDQSIAASWDNDNLRGICLGIERAQRVSIVLDRRLDPSASRSLRVTGETLLSCIQRLAAESDAGATVIGNAAYLGPRDTAAHLRTLVALRRQELFDKRGEIPESRQIALTHPITFRWSDFDRPADLVGRLAGEYMLSVEGLDYVPHDLWAGGVLPETTAIEGLSLLLAQFELTFSWIDRARGVRIEPFPRRIVIDNAYDPPRGAPPATALARWKEEIPELDARIENGKIVVSGTEEQHEVVNRVRRGGRANDKTISREGAKPKPLDKQRFSGKIQNIPASAVLKDLETPDKGQLTFEYDRAEFKAAGIDLDKPVTLELKEAKIEDLLKATLDPLGVTFEMHGRTVKLRPARRPDAKPE
jgi:hypothetical protein